MAERLVPVAEVGEIPPGERKLVEVDGKSIGVFNVHGEYYAVLNVCPHELAPVCLGRLTGTTHATAVGEYRWIREGEILVCPWHGWEFDLKTGQALADRRRLRRYPVEVRDQVIYLRVAGATL